MKGIKIYLAVVTLLLIVALGFGIYVWYVLQTVESETAQLAEPDREKEGGEKTDDSTLEEYSTPAASESTDSITIDTNALPQGQQKALEAMGVEGDTLVITAEMMRCAEEALGKERLDAIIGGAPPGPIESVLLLGCTKQ